MAIPSSIHEFLIAPFDDRMSMDDYSSMVQEVNAEQVPAEECLADKAFVLGV